LGLGSRHGAQPPTSLTRPNSVTTHYGYDNLSRLTSVLHQLAGSTIDGATYTVDNAGNRTAKTDNRANVTTNYGYNNIYQLLSATQVRQPRRVTPGAGSTWSLQITSIPVGNRLSSLGVASYTNNTSNELTATSLASYGYDLNGNAVTKNDSTGITTYNLDYENRLTSVVLPGSGGTVTFSYDPFGRRIKKTVSSTGVTSISLPQFLNLNISTKSRLEILSRLDQRRNYSAAYIR
jgi:YD repeat-containing protein